MRTPTKQGKTLEVAPAENEGNSSSHVSNELPKRQRPFPVNIVIPMAGRGSRFANVGFVQPKPIIDVGGRPMISWVLDNVDSPLIEATFILLVLREHEEWYGLAEKLRPLKQRMKFVVVDEVTEGAACTALLAREYVNNSSPMLVVNSDQFVEWSADDFWKQMMDESERGIDGNMLCFHIAMEKNDARWSYAKLEPTTGLVTDVQEKKAISSNATVGFYYWREGRDFVASAEAMMADDFRVNGEFYMAPVYNYGTRQFGRRYTASFCQAMWGLGVPEDLVRFLSEYVRPRMAGVDQSGPAQARASGPLRFIAHRGNVEGADAEQENRPEYIQRALSLGFDVEVDVWRDNANDTWHLGHDGPRYPVAYDFLLTPRLWIYCKNGPALQILSREPRVHCFFHHRDYIMTSKGLMWTYPGKPLLGPNSIAVMFRAPAQLLAQDIYGLCHDDVGPLRRQYIAMQARRVPARTVKLIIFDLDGVLVESRDLHYEALNQAIEELAGNEYVIERQEHLSVYDGLSTNQKLAMLMVQKNLPFTHHQAIWKRKQALTDELVRKMLKPTAHITQTLAALKRCGYSVAVASNCIRSSVVSILEAVGLLHHVDVFLSNEDVASAKPAPDIYLKTYRAFCVKPSETLVVEDSQKGFEAAVRAGCHLLKVRNPDDVSETRIFRRIAEVQAPVRPVTVVVPLAGIAADFWLDGHAGSVAEVPLFLSDANGRPVLECVMDALRSDRFPMHFVFLIKESHAKACKLESLCLNAVGYAPSSVVTVPGDTLDAIKTVLNCPRSLVDPDAPLLIVDGNHVLSWGPGRSVDDLTCHADGAMTVHTSSDPRWAYVRLVPESPSAVAEVLIREEPVGTLACTGYYFYRRAESFFTTAEALVARKERHRGSYFIAPTFTEMVKRGQTVEAVRVEHVWSLRTVSEVKDFALHYFPWVSEAAMTKIYTEMATRQAAFVASEGLVPDQRLYDAPDKRRCLAAYTLCSHRNFYPTELLSKLQQELFDILGPEQCHYRPLTEEDAKPWREGGAPSSNTLDAILHFTFMQFISFAMFDKVKVPPDYGEMVEAVLQRSLPSFQITFSRVVLTRASVLLLGFPSVNVNAAREQMRRTSQKMDFPLFEPYKNDIVHMTLVRFASPVTDAQLRSLQRVLDLLPRSAQFASLLVNQLHFSGSSWKMQLGELEDLGKVIAPLKGA